MRIAVGGFQHETNTFAPQPATLADFIAPDAWPGLTRGPELLDAVRGINLPAAGFIDEAHAGGHTIVPLTWCSATPSGRVTREAYEHVAQLLIDDLRAQRHLDAVYLDLHGAMVAEHIDDGDGELLRRIRSLVGPELPVIASLDFHANVSEQMLEQASALVAYRTYPHVDMAATGERAMRCLARIRGNAVVRSMRQPPFLIPLTSQCTLIEPLASIFEEVAREENPSAYSLNFTPGFPAADVAECGPSIFGYGSEPARLADAVERITERVIQCEHEFALEVFSIDDVLREVSRAPAPRGRPLILADTQDNPGGGGTASTTSLLKALIERRVSRVLAGVICDPQAAGRAHEAGIGATIELEVGAFFGDSGGVAGETPIRDRFTVAALGDGRFVATGPFYLGSRMELGPMALLRTGDVFIVVASRKQQAADQAMFRHLGAEPAEFSVLALKSSVHFRADFGPIASRVLVVEAPGPNTADPSKLPFTKIRRPHR
ncbi:microcystin degradation protein MlrC [Povalibacter uvarum]|uniref:Microcystinase C n=2 Tax=Povalibacter uvarum TaxID=732238 RepID=A0A841HJP2_9GAMM|nr:microcystin degradation protein MlrC [Povalibacter uvarum]